MLRWWERWDRGDFFGWLFTFGVGAFFGGFRWVDAVWLVPATVVAAMLASEYLTPLIRRIERWRTGLSPEAAHRLQLAVGIGFTVAFGALAAIVIWLGA